MMNYLSRKPALWAAWTLSALLASSCSGGEETADPGVEMFSVGGTIEGLEGLVESLALRLNGDEQLMVSLDGEFQFEGRLPAGSDYRVTIEGSPSGEIVIDNARGSVGGNVSDIHIVCRGWRLPTGESDSLSVFGSHADQPLVVLGADGDSITIWSQNDDLGIRQPFRSEYRDGSLDRPQGLEDNFGIRGLESSVSAVDMAENGDVLMAMVAEGNLFLVHRRDGVWIEPTSSDDAINPTGGEAFTAYVRDVSVAMHPNGDAIVTWQQWNGAEDQVYISEFRDGAWSHPSDLSESIGLDGGSCYNVRSATSANGDAIVSYVFRHRSRTRFVMMSEYRDGQWIHPSSVDDAASPLGYVYDLDVAMSDTGDAVIAWNHNSNNELNILMSEYRDGAWNHPLEFADGIAPSGSSFSEPTVAMAPNGDTLIAWTQEGRGIREAIYVSEYRDGAWDHPTDVEDRFSGDARAGNPRLAMAGEHAVIAFTRSYGSFQYTFVVGRDAGEWREPVRVAPLLYDCENPSVAVNRAGQVIVAWMSYSDRFGQVFQARYH